MEVDARAGEGGRGVGVGDITSGSIEGTSDGVEECGRDIEEDMVAVADAVADQFEI